MKEDAGNTHSEGESNLSRARVKWDMRQRDKTTRRLLETDSRHFLHQSLSTPCLDVLTGCDGIYIVTEDGRRLMDFHGNSVHQVGYANPRVITAISRQLKKQTFAPRRYTNPPAVKLAEKLSGLAPGDLNRVLFAPGGTTVIGIALKLARAVTGRHKTVSLWDSFHGASLDAISVGGKAMFRRDIGPLLSGTEHVPPPDESNCVFGCAGKCNLQCANYIEYVLDKEGDVGAVVAETVRAVPVIPSRKYWKKVREACDRHGTLLILDEIPNGLGRTGRMFAFEHYGIVPDIVCLGKGLGGGIMPIAALIAREFINGAQAKGALGHYTHEKNPVCCAAALATLEEIEKRSLLDHTRMLGEQALSCMKKLKEKHSTIGDCRGLGLLMGISMVRQNDPQKPNPHAAEQVLYRAIERGLSFKVSMGNILTLTPPLIISSKELANAFDILDECIGLVECG